jgi:hypothetical protein
MQSDIPSILDNQVVIADVTLSIAEGSIDPLQRVQTGAINAQTINDLCSWLRTPEPYVVISGAVVPTACVDGRSRKDGTTVLGFNAAGGTFSLVMADALSHNDFRPQTEHAHEHARSIYRQLLAIGYPIGGHDDDDAQYPACGCGAEDRLDSIDPTRPSILRFIIRRGAEIRTMLEGLGLLIDDSLHETILAHSADLIKEGYFKTGDALRQAIIELAGEEAMVTLHGAHKEVALVLNSDITTSLNRQVICDRFGPKYQVFNLDIAALERAVTVIALSAQEAHEKFIAAVYYNLATAAVLAGPSMRIISR